MLLNGEHGECLLDGHFLAAKMEKSTAYRIAVHHAILSFPKIKDTKKGLYFVLLQAFACSFEPSPSLILLLFASSFALVLAAAVTQCDLFVLA